MKRILYLSLLLVIPFFLHADHGRNRLNGKWISPYFNKQIKLKVKRHHIRVKGITGRGWTTFTPIRRKVFEDCYGNRIRINNIHDLVYSNRRQGIRISFVKKGHNHHNHTCNSGCSIGSDYFTYSGYNDGYYEDYYDDYYDDYDSWGYDNRNDRYRNRNGNRNRNRERNRDRDRNRDYYESGFNGRYHVREIDKYVTISRTSFGLKAQLDDEKAVLYTQNRFRKNEYVDKEGNKYVVLSNGDLAWKSKNGKVSLNLQK